MDIVIHGLASQKKIATLKIDQPISQNISLMKFLISHNIRIASSCNGEGLCNKCIINNSIISCQISLLEFVNLHKGDLNITVSYL